MLASRVLIVILACLCAAAPAAAEKLTNEQLGAFMEVAPPPPQGWTRAQRSGNYSSADASTFSLTYTGADGQTFLFTVTFSKKNADQNRELIKDAKRRDLYGMDLEKIKGRDALVKKPASTNKFLAVYLVILGEARSVSVTDTSGKVDRAVLKAFIESADLDAIAKK